MSTLNGDITLILKENYLSMPFNHIFHGEGVDARPCSFLPFTQKNLQETHTWKLLELK